MAFTVAQAATEVMQVAQLKFGALAVPLTGMRAKGSLIEGEDVDMQGGVRGAGHCDQHSFSRP